MAALDTPFMDWAFTQSPFALAIHDRDLLCLRVNDRMCQMFGLTEDELRARFAQGLDQGWSVTVVEMGGRIVGFLAMRPCDGVLDQLFLAPDAQGKGIGSMLLGLARVAMPNGFWLRTAAANKLARRFYEAKGLTIDRVEPHPVHGHDTVIYLSTC